jgi:hypothetical protein
MKDKILGYILGVLTYLGLKVLWIDLVLVAMVSLSFLVWEGFTWSAFGERLIWTGIGTALIAGILVMGQTVGGRQYGVQTLGSPNGPRGIGRIPDGVSSYTAAQSSPLINWNLEIRRQIDERFDFRFQVFLIGAFLFIAGMLVDILSK